MFDNLSLEQKVDIILQHVVGTGKGALAGISNWVPEKTACAMIGYSSRVLRRKCKLNELPIDWRVKATGRGFEYSLKSINEYKQNTGTA